MKTLIIAAALAVATVLVATTPPAEAGYISPEWSWQTKAFCTRGC